MPLALIDAELLLHDLDELGAIGADPRGGVTRIAYSPAERAGRAWIAQQMQRLGMHVTSDAAGNTIGRYPGTSNLPALALGSHSDTVAQGGRYDGALGILAGLAVVRAVRDSGMQLRHPIELIDFAAEEATILGTFGSRAMAGELPASDLTKPAYDGRPVQEHLMQAGIDPQAVLTARRPVGSMAAYLELHIEQGDTLESEAMQIGIVEGIVGIRRYDVQITGRANHAGTTQMQRRQDALVAAAEFILAVRDTARAYGIVGTVGTLSVQPNVPNVIPGQVLLSFEIRALDDTLLNTVEAELYAHAARLGGQVHQLGSKEPVVCDRHLMDSIAQACTSLGLKARPMPSGAGHDAMSIASIAPIAMIFVPSQAGVSHAPDEYTTPDDCVHGARVLLATVLALDAIADSR